MTIAELDEKTKSDYLKEHAVRDNRLSKLKHASGWAVPEIYAMARSGNDFKLKRLIVASIAKEGTPAVVDRRCVLTGRALLHEACVFGHKGTIDLLCSHFGADVQLKTLMGGDTPLHLAASKNQRAICFALMTSYGADPNALNKHKWTPLHYAATYGTLSTVKCLIQYGGRAGDKNDAGKAPATLAF